MGASSSGKRHTLWWYMMDPSGPSLVARRRLVSGPGPKKSCVHSPHGPTSLAHLDMNSWYIKNPAWYTSTRSSSTHTSTPKQSQRSFFFFFSQSTKQPLFRWRCTTSIISSVREISSGPLRLSRIRNFRIIPRNTRSMMIQKTNTKTPFFFTTRIEVV